MDPWLRALTALVQDLDLIPGILVVTQSFVTPVLGHSLLVLNGTRNTFNAFNRHASKMLIYIKMEINL